MNEHSAPQFASTLDEAPTEVKSFPLIPVGTYLCRVGQWENNDKEEGYIEVPFTLLQALEDVDPEELEAIGGLDGEQVIKRRYFTSEKAAFFIDQLHQDCGIDLSQPLTRRARMDMIINAEVLGVVTHGSSKKNPGRVYANIDRTLPVT